MTYREINGDRVAFQENVLRNLKAELSDQGIVVDILNIRSAEAPGTYAEDLAAAELAEAQQVAAIARANASREAEFAQIAADTAIAERRRDLSLKQSQWKSETDREAAIAEASGQISRQEQDVLVEERKREALAAQALATQEQLDISEKKPADAAAYAAAKRAEGAKQAAQHNADAELYTRTRTAEADAAAARLAAKAQAYTTKTQADARADAARVTAQAEADATRARGLADAEVARQVGQAEADATTAKADALGRYGEQSLAYEVVQRLPSPTRGVRWLTDAVAAGAQDDQIAGVETVLRPALEATAQEVLSADAVILGTSANFGYMSGALKHFFDSTFLEIGGQLDEGGGGRAGSGTAAGSRALPYALYVHGRYDLTGAVRSVESIVGAIPWRRAAPHLEVLGDIGDMELEAAYELGATLAALVAD